MAEVAFEGTVLMAFHDLQILNRGGIPIRLNGPLCFVGFDCEHFVLTPRPETRSISSLADRSPVDCSLTGIPQDGAASPDPLGQYRCLMVL